MILIHTAKKWFSFTVTLRVITAFRKASDWTLFRATKIRLRTSPHIPLQSILILSSYVRLSVSVLPWDRFIPTKICTYPASPMVQAPPTLLSSITVTILSEEQKMWSSSSCNFLYSLVTSSLRTYVLMKTCYIYWLQIPLLVCNLTVPITWNKRMSLARSI
jgi:hypothetical protein